MFIAIFAADIPDRCGAFYSDLCLGNELKRRGHQVILISCAPARGNFAGGEYEGFHWRPYISAGKELDQSNLWISPHYPHGNIVRRLNRTYRRPIIFTLHFAGATSMFNVPFPVNWTETIWYVNKFIPVAMLNGMFPSFVSHHELRRPFIEKAPILLDSPGTHDHITLINANMIKGLTQFLKIAKELPNHKFLGIRSFYYPPKDANHLEVPPNITWIDFTRDVKSIYARTRIMLVLSGTESFCITAAESMINGIPVIYSTPTGENYDANILGSTEGVAEWIDPVGIAIPRNDTSGWVSEILKLDDPGVYSAKSADCRSHAESAFNTAPGAADYALSFANSNPVRVNSIMSVRSDPFRSREQAPLPVVPTRPSQPAAWRNGRLTFGRR
jgi:hypothetical protein